MIDSLTDSYKANVQTTIPYEWDEPISERTCQILKVLGRKGVVCWFRDPNLDVDTEKQVMKIAEEYGLVFNLNEICVLVDPRSDKMNVLE